MTDERIALEEIAAVRQRTIALYAKMAALTDAAALGFKPRQPGDPDITIRLIEAALRDAPQEARMLLREVADNDESIVRMVRELIDG